MSLALGFMIIVMPIVIFLGVGFNVPIMWSTFLMTFVILSLWPALWNIIGILGETIWKVDADPLKTMIYGIFASLFQGVSPYFIVRLIKGEGAHTIMKTATQSTSQIMGTTTSHAQNFENGIKAGINGDGKAAVGGGGAAGYGLGYVGNQIASRFSNAKSAYGGIYGLMAQPNKTHQFKQGLKGLVQNSPVPRLGLKQFASGFKSQTLTKGNKL